MTTQTTSRNEVLDVVLGTELVNLFKRGDITEIYVNSDGYIRYLSGTEGKVITDIYLTDKQRAAIIELIAGQADKIVNEDIPSISTEIRGYGYRFQGELPPIVKTPEFNIRKRATIVFTLDDYVANGTITENYKDYIENAISLRKNILVVGGTATGKTTFLNAILEAMARLSPFHRIISLEDLPELQCPASDYSPMFTKQETNSEKSIKYNMTRLLRECMRRSPDRIVIGEVRDGCAYTMLKAWNTGHPGGACTVHANSAMSGINRIKSLAQEDPDSSSDIIKDLIGDAIDVIISIVHTDLGNGKRGRIVNEIIEVESFSEEKNTYITKVIPRKEHMNER